jgi:hypothetical protein
MVLALHRGTCIGSSSTPKGEAKKMLHFDTTELEREMAALAHARIDMVVGNGVPHMSQKEAAQVLRRSAHWVHSMVKNGRLPVIRLNGVPAITRAVAVRALVYGV